MRRHQYKHILQEDECVINWHGKQDGGKESSEKEISWLDKSPSALFVDLENDSIERSFGLLDLHDFKSFADDRHEENWDDNGENKEHI